MDLTRELGWLRFDDTPAVRLGGADAVDALLDRGATFASTPRCSAARRVPSSMAVEYAKDRVQFGRPDRELPGREAPVRRHARRRRGHALDRRTGRRGASAPVDADASVAASTAKIWCSDASKRVMASALQVHGGIGFTWEHDLHLFLKRAQLDQVSFGDAAYHRQRLADLLRPRVEAGESVI